MEQDLSKKITITTTDVGIIVNIQNVLKEMVELKSNYLLVEFIDDALNDVGYTECNEINTTMDRGGLWIGDNNVYFFTNNNVSELKNTGITTLEKDGVLEDYIDTSKKTDIDFLKWYYSSDNEQDAVQTFYKTCGWVVTDIDTFQAYKEIEEDKIYQFRENRYRPDIENGILGNNSYMCEETLNYEDISADDLANACYDFGYSDEQVDQWLSEGEEIPLMLECYFESN